MNAPSCAMVDQSCSSVLRSKANTSWRWALSSAVATKTRLPYTIGLACPRPGTAACQITFSVLLHTAGTVAVRILPSDDGPRHQGQSLSAVDVGTSLGAIPAI